MAQWSIVGPLFDWELRRLQRRGRVQRLRCVVGLSLLLAVYVLYGITFNTWNPFTFSTNANLSVHEMSQFTFRLFFTLQMVQGGLILIGAPIYILDVIAGPKEHGTFDELFLTQLHPHEILLGRTAARAVHLLGLVLVTVPLLAFVQLWGGIDLALILTSFWVNGWGLLSAVAFALMCSTLARTVLMAALMLLGCWSLLGVITGCHGLGYCTTPLHYWIRSNSFGVVILPEFSLLVYTVYHAAVTLFALSMAQHHLRPLEAPPPSSVPPPPVDPPAFDPANLVFAAPTVSSAAPIWWKERHFGLPRTPGWFIAGMIIALCLLVPLLVIWVRQFETKIYGRKSAHELGMIVGVVSFLAGLRTLRAICVERQRQTLTGLLVLPMDRTTILIEKWCGAATLVVLAGVGVGICACTATMMSKWSILMSGFFCFAAVVEVIFFVTFALWLSVWIRHLTQGVLLLIGGYFSISYLPALVGLCLQSTNVRGIDDLGVWMASSLAPWTVWWLPFHSLGEPWDGLLLGRLLFLLASAVLWRDTCRRFRQLEG